LILLATVANLGLATVVVGTQFHQSGFPVVSSALPPRSQPGLPALLISSRR
jgi:hypothetical protein